MTRPSRSSLVLDGSEVKYRLEAERLASKTPVHVDWVRFTVLRRNAPFVAVDHLFPHPDTNIWDDNYRAAQQARVLREIPDCDFDAATQGLELAQTVAAALGTDFAVNPEHKKGHDFYKFRWCIERNGAECGWVGFLSSGESPRQKAQAQTIHCNLFGMACTFASHGWPTSSKVGQVLEESASQTGVKVKTESLTVTGPATSPGAQSVTNNTTNNTTKTETTTYNHTYQGDTINTTAVTVTNITNTTTGAPISSETTTETPEKEEDPPEVDLTDTPLPAQPKLYTPKYPNGLEGVWTQQKANLSSTPLANLAGRLMPNVGSSGTCPTMSIDLSLAAWADFGIKDVAPPCYVWDWARLIVLIGALLLARALIFGG